MIKYEYFDDGRLLITKYTGDIDKETIKSYIQFIFSKSNCENLENLILDFRDAKLSINLTDLNEIAHSRKTVDVGQNKSVFLVETPMETALIIMISKMYNRDLKPADFCSTIKGCIQNLSLEITEDGLNRRLNTLKFEFSE